MRIEVLSGDDERAEMESFLKKNISDPSRVPVFPASCDPHRDYRSYVLAFRDSKGVAAALYAGSPVLEVMQLQGLPHEAGEAALRDMVMLYAVATRPDCRRQGLAGALVRELESGLQRTGHGVIYGVSQADAVSFYLAEGFLVLPPETGICLRWGPSASVFPIEGDAQWFSKDTDYARGKAKNALVMNKPRNSEESEDLIPSEAPSGWRRLLGWVMGAGMAKG